MSSPGATPQPGATELVPVYRAAITTMTSGFRTGAALLIVGLAVALLRREPLSNAVDPFAEIIPKILDGEAAGIIDLAILVMMATPLATVIVIALGFHRADDRRYARLSLIVLGILGISVLLSLLR